jgi:hypothetical protein
MVIEGEISIDEHILSHRDAVGITNADSIHIRVKKPSFLLIMDIPMQIES